MLLCYIDDIVYDGDFETFCKIALFASYYAVTKLGIKADISGIPLVYYPTYPTPLIVYHYMIEYRNAFNFLEAFLDF